MFEPWFEPNVRVGPFHIYKEVDRISKANKDAYTRYLLIAVFLVIGDHVEVCFLSDEAKFEPLSAPLQTSFRLLHTPVPPVLSPPLTVRFPGFDPPPPEEHGAYHVS